jgi:hypothetical protein
MRSAVRWKRSPVQRPLRRSFGERGRQFVQERYGAEARVESYVRVLSRG